MESEDETPVKDVTPKPEDTTPAPEHVPPAVHPEPDNELKSLVESLSAKVDELSTTVTSIVESGNDRDSTPVKKPWTHRWQ